MSENRKGFENIKSLREKQGNMSQLNLSMKIGVSQEAISKMETGETKGSVENVEKIADYFNTSVDYILGRTDDPTPLSMLQGKFTDQEIEFLNKFKLLSKEGQVKLNGYLDALISTNDKNNKD